MKVHKVLSCQRKILKKESTFAFNAYCSIFRLLFLLLSAFFLLLRAADKLAETPYDEKLNYGFRGQGKYSLEKEDSSILNSVTRILRHTRTRPHRLFQEGAPGL